MATNRVVKWFHPKVHTGWHKEQSLAYRRRLVRESHGGNYLTSAKSLLALANVSKDSATRKAARADANYFFKMHEKHK
jgi:hypothetical protein